MRILIPLGIFGLFVFLVVSCAPKDGISNNDPKGSGSVNRLTPEEEEEGWMLLFNGKDLQGWRTIGRNDVSGGHWIVEDRAIKKVEADQVSTDPDGQSPERGDLITTDTYGDFELQFEWKVSRAGNSGIKYNVSEDMSTAREPSYAALGFEYQIIDGEGHPQVQSEDSTYMAGALYDLVPPRRRAVRQVGEWNRARIVLCGQYGEHWLNGRKVVEYELESPRFDSLLAASKFDDISDFTDRRQGPIVLQDHNDTVWYRNIKLRELREESCKE